MKKIGSISLAILLTLCVGCGNGNNTPVEEPTQEVVEDIAKQEEVHKFVEKDFENFFKNYFSFTDSELLILNQQRATTDEGYWNNLKEDYQDLIGAKLGTYLSDGLKNRLKIQYVHDQINLPKFVLMNNYVVSGKGDVEKVEIKSTRELGESTVYEVAVTTANKCYPVTDFVTQYTWGKTEGYFIAAQAGTTALGLEGIDLEAVKAQNYMFSTSSSTDQMKMEQNFWVTVADQKELKVESIKNASDWGVATPDKNEVLDGQYINRVAYEVEPTEIETTLINRLFVTLFQQPKSVYEYLNTAYNTNAQAFNKVFEELGFQNKFTILEETYKAAYATEINPYKDEIAVLKTNDKTIKIIPSVYSTMHQPRFVVTVPVEALHNNNQVVYYSYKYYVGIEKGAIELIQFMGIKESDKYEYDSGVDEEELTKIAQEFGVDKDALANAAKRVEMSVEELITKTKEEGSTNPINVAETIKPSTEGTSQEITNEETNAQDTNGETTNTANE